jgi:S-adenosylmethionine synthetase
LRYSFIIHEQSADINQGVELTKEEKLTGMMFGYATNGEITCHWHMICLIVITKLAV